MPKPLNLLIVEDSVDDATLLLLEIRRAGFDPKWKRVETERDYLAELKNVPELIISDYSLPQFSGLRAAKLAQQSGLEIPFILVSGTVGEDAAVEAMKCGATDYLLKDRIARLGNAVERVLEENQLRKERKKTLEELLFKTALLEAQVDSAPDAILIVNEQGRRILHNQKLTDLFAVPRNVIMDGDDVGLLQHVIKLVKNPQQFTDRVAHLYANPEEIGRDEIELLDGRVLDRYSAPVRDKSGKYYGRIWTFRDISEQRKLEEQFRQAQKMEAIGQLAGGVAHDFNNILAVIQMQAGLLRSEDNLSAIHLELTAEIEKAAYRATNLTRQLLLFSRRQALNLRDLDLNDIVSQVAKMLQRILGEDVHMQYKFDTHSLIVHADQGMIDQVLMNLTVNARDAMPDGGQVTIETSSVEIDEKNAAEYPRGQKGSFACLTVNDCGSGIPAETLPHIFEPFFTTKDVGKGTGLGLATVFGIVQQHKGWVEVESEIGTGTTFRVYLPKLARKSIPEDADLSSLANFGGNETILIVEDDVHLRNSERKVLKHLGYRVLEAADGLQAIGIWEEEKSNIHLVLTDLIMPGGITGRDLVMRLLKQKPDLKVIYASGYSPELNRPDFQLEEGVNFLAKPFLGSVLAKTIRQRLDS